jgi:hypothetical protein
MGIMGKFKVLSDKVNVDRIFQKESVKLTRAEKKKPI